MDKDYTPFEPHHFYWGIILMLIGFVLIFVETISVWWSISIMGIGFIMVVDDAIQHIMQRKNRAYHSPIHILYCKYIYPIPWVKELNDWADKIMGKL